MARTPSQMLALGTPLPEFSLPDTVSGRTVSSADCAGKVSVILFMCNHCPFVIHVRQAILALGRHAKENGAIMLAVSSNDVSSHPMDGPELMAEEARTQGYPFPYLYDETQEVAKAFRAACTPDLYIFDAQGTLAYRGQLDDARPSNTVPPSGRDAMLALDALLAGRAPSAEQKASIGCNIKWKPGNAPAYYG